MTREILRGMLEGKIRFPTARKAIRDFRNRPTEAQPLELSQEAELVQAAEARADARPAKVRSFAEKIPQMNKAELIELSSWDMTRLRELYNSTPTNIEEVNFARQPKLFAASKAIMFVHRANEHALGESKLESFDPTLKKLTNYELKNAIPTPFGYMRKDPRVLPNLLVVFERMVEKVRGWRS